ncbi:MAG TPA: hypothetical protein VFQ77_06680 [Pseudonocardiaceae bacterium]|jgi:hypothetical protein|nr:hypothetical protein [Pseudonocardiaceae bacterium]
MSAPITAGPRTRGQQLAAEAAEAAEVRDALTHPDVVALRVERLRGRVDRFIWTGMILGLGFTMTTVQQFTAQTTGADPGSLGWCAAWLLDPTVSVILLGVLLAERETSRWQIPVGRWARAAKWSLLTATYVMNTWGSWAAGDLAGIVLHSVPPLAVFTAAEAVTDCQDKLTEATHRAHAWATQRAERKAQTERDKQAASETGNARPAPVAGPVPAVLVPPPATPPFRAVSNRPDPTLAVRPADRSDPPTRATPPERSAERPTPARADRPGARTRSGPARKRTGKARTDAHLVAAVRELAEANGGTPPSQYQVKQVLGVGSGRAARLLADLDDLAPAGPAARNGAAPRKDGAR